MFDAEAYLRQLIDHLVALASSSGRSDVVREQVESAAAALSAAGLIVPSEVSDWGERATDGLEAAGLITRISFEQSVHRTVTTMQADDAAPAPSPPRRD